MSLLQDNRKIEDRSKKIYIFCGAGIVTLIFIIVALLALVSVIKKNKITLMINGQSSNVNSYLIKRDDTIYIELENLTKTIAKGGYTYKKGNKDIEDDNQCYITNSSIQESVFFKADSNEIYKTSENSNDVIHYTISKAVIKENEKFYIPIDDCKLALNMKTTKNNNQYILSTIEYLESYYNKQASNTFVPDTSIVWDTLADNKKLLRDGLVIVKDDSGNLGIAAVKMNTDSKKKVSKVTTSEILPTKYKYIRYVEKYNQLIVETTSGRGIVEFKKQDDGNYSIKTIIAPQYDDIKQLNEESFIISKISGDNSSNKIVRYGIINKSGEAIIPTEYQKIGVDLSKYTNNNIENEYIIYDYLIPVKKNDLWGLINLNGESVVDCIYTDLGCDITNPATNVFIIPEKELIVVRKDKNYGIINKTGKTVIRPVLTKIFQENEIEKKYYMIYNDSKTDIINYLDNARKTGTKSENGTNENNNSDNKTEQSETDSSKVNEEKDSNNTEVKEDNKSTETTDKSTETEKSTETKNDNETKVIIID